MALTATMFRFDVDLSDVDRGVYERLEIRAAQHPSETMPYLLTRVLAYCLCYEEGITFSRGLSMADEPALWVKDLQGQTRVWIEVGTPSAERLHKAAKAVSRVLVFTQHAIELLHKNLRGQKVHRIDEIEAYVVDPQFLNALEPLTERTNAWSLARNDGEIYLTTQDTKHGHTLTTHVVRHALSPA